ncbi:AAA family ATPase [Nocardioides piscis]|nr:AAA family ATPase [Nocardioides piscis]
MLAGARGLGKTLLALSWAAAVATGQETTGNIPVRVHGPVVYIALEGFHGIPRRLRAWEAHQGVRADGIIWVRDGLNLRDWVEADLLGRVVAHYGAVLTIVDSVRAAGAGKEDTQDMGAFVKGLERVQQSAGGLVLALHNTGWDAERERGSTLLPDACDTTLLLKGDPAGVRTLHHRKHRDGEMLEHPLAYAFRKIEGTGSGVLLPTDVPGASATLPDLLLAAIHRTPGMSTGYYATELNRHRPNTATALTGLATEGRVRNDGTKNRPTWVIPAEEPLV